jgi:hypothetical protein
VVNWVTSGDNAGTQTTTSENDKSHTVAVERSIVVHRSTNRTYGGGQTQRGSLEQERTRVDKRTASESEEEIVMTNFAARPIVSTRSTDFLKEDDCSERSSGSMDALELGNQTQVVASGKPLERN